MLKILRQQITQTLWQIYRSKTSQAFIIEEKLIATGIKKLLLDHFAIIDLPGPNTGISQLQTLFSLLGYQVSGGDYLADKQNDFIWMKEVDSEGALAQDVLPQIVLADFRLHELPNDVRNIIERYARFAKPAPIEEIKSLLEKMQAGNEVAMQKIHDVFIHYFAGRDWPLPTVNEFYTVHAFNELLAWVLVFGREPNHFTLSIHLLNVFTDLPHFHDFIEQEAKLPLNHEGGTIKGNRKVGLTQGSTLGKLQKIKLADGEIELPSKFVEFIWRYPVNTRLDNPKKWDDYFTGFIAQHADRIIESLFVEKT